ncbi:unnamed protein product [Adineta ricciae]|uniref:Uncharacterized protein n=1 Tax=Adineta ricciae TaxID=249248 RepID=A0A814PBL7_ADIRI|nr:unnamed protein product [Adineta ricciae]
MLNPSEYHWHVLLQIDVISIQRAGEGLFHAPHAKNHQYKQLNSINLLESDRTTLTAEECDLLPQVDDPFDENPSSVSQHLTMSFTKINRQVISIYEYNEQQARRYFFNLVQYLFTVNATIVSTYDEGSFQEMIHLIIQRREVALPQRVCFFYVCFERKITTINSHN